MNKEVEDIYLITKKKILEFGARNSVKPVDKLYKSYILDTWMTQDKVKIKLVDMDDRHITNCIKLLERNLTKTEPEYRTKPRYKAKVLLQIEAFKEVVEDRKKAKVANEIEEWLK